jgi:integrase
MRHRNDGLTKHCECGHRKWAKCRHPWSLAFYKKICACPSSCACKGNRTRVSLHKVAGKPLAYWMSKSEAEGLADKLRTRVREGGPTTSREAPLTVGQLADRYLDEHVKRPGRRPGPIGAATNYLRIIRRLKVNGQPFGEYALDAVTPDHVEALRDGRRAELREAKRLHAEGKTKGRVVLPQERGGEIGVEHLMATLRHMFSWAAKKNLVAGSPFKRNGEVVVEVKATVERGRERRLEGDEEARLLAAAQPHLKDVILGLLETGCRVGELLSLRWSDVRGDTIVLRTENTKTARPRAVPIMSRMKAVLDARRNGPDGEPHAADRYPFGNEVGERIKRVRRAWDATCRRAGIEDLNIHDLRREFGSRLLESGAALHDVSYWLGHTNVSTTSQYLRTTVERLRRAAKLFEEARRIDKRLTNEEAA